MKPPLDVPVDRTGGTRPAIGPEIRPEIGAEIRAEIVGSVLEVLVGPGSAVVEGDVLVLMESMKMEIPIVCERPGTVRSVAVAEGDTVRRGELLAVLG